MRRYLQPALENYDNAPALGDESISMEEEAIMLDESSQAAAEASQDLNEAERIVQVSDALEDLAVVAGSKDEVSDTEAALMEKAGDMAVAGTDIAPDEIVPAMESFRVDGKISGSLAMENFREKADRIWQNIKRILKEIWEKISTFFYKIFGTIPRRRKSLKALAERVAETHSLTRKEAKFTVASSRFMFVGNNQVKTASAYKAGLKDVVATAEWVYEKYVGHLKTVSDKVAKALGDFDSSEPQKAVKQLAADLVSTANLAKLPGGSGVSSQRWSHYEVTRGHELLGGDSIFHLGAKKAEGSGDLATLDYARQAMFTIAPSQDKANGKNNSIEFQTMDQTESLDMIRSCERLLDLMENYQRGKTKGEIESSKKKIEEASNKAEKAGNDKRGSSEEADRIALPYFRALVNFNVAYARWVESPTIAFTKLAFGIINQTEVLISRSMAQYK